MSAVLLTQTVVHARMNLVRDMIDGGLGPGRILIFDSGRPNAPDEPPKPEAVLLAVLTFARPSAQNAKDGTLMFKNIEPESNALATGRATWARITDSDGNAVFDSTVTMPNRGGMIQLDTVEIAAGGVLMIHDFVVQEIAP